MSAVTAARSAMDGSDEDALKVVSEHLGQASLKIAEAASTAQTGAASSPDGNAPGQSGAKVVDAEFEEVENRTTQPEGRARGVA